MVIDKPYGDNCRIGVIINHSYSLTLSKLWAKRAHQTGRIMRLKQDGTPFKEAQKEK